MAQEANGKSPNMFQQQAQQYPATTGTPVSGAQGQWTTGLCGCFEDCSNCKSWNLLKVFLFFIYCIYFSQLSFLLFSAGCISFCCPCITFGQNVEIIDRGTTCKLQKKKKTKHEQFIQYFINWYSFLPSSCTSWFIIWLCAACAHAGFIYYCLAHVGFASCYSCTYRTKLRASFNLPEDPCADCLVHCCCLPCAVCQEYRELKNRGVDPSIGNWPGFF